MLDHIYSCSRIPRGLLALLACLVALHAVAPCGVEAESADPVAQLLAAAHQRDLKATQLRDAAASERTAAQRLLEGEVRLRAVEEQRAQAEHLKLQLEHQAELL